MVRFSRGKALVAAIALLCVACTASGWAAATRTPKKTEKPAAKLVDLNTATEAQLEEVPGIGAVYAKKIVAGRPYKAVADLTKAGIPTATVEKIKGLVMAGPVPPAKSEKPAAKIEKVLPKTEPPVAKTEQPAVKTGKPATKTEARPATGQTPPQKGMVWANTSSKIYHKEGDRWYGKTKDGKWLTEQDAIKAGYRAAKE